MDDGLAHEHSIERIAMERGKPADVESASLIDPQWPREGRSKHGTGDEAGGEAAGASR
jgi:hypothetical protein